MAKRRERCRFCGELFVPNPRVKSRQYACKREGCQKERHRQNCLVWNGEHREQSRGQYEVTARWLEDHPGYLAEYRREHEEAAEKHRRTERERLRRRREAQRTEQDPRGRKQLQGGRLGRFPPCWIYKTRCGDNCLSYRDLQRLAHVGYIRRDMGLSACTDSSYDMLDI